MGTEENVRVIREAVEAINAHDADRLFSHYVESVIARVPGEPEPLKGKAALRDRFVNFTTAFPDLHFEVVRLFGEGDWLCAELIGTGTHKGPLRGPGGVTLPATNRFARNPMCIVYGFEDGEITQVNQYFDLAGLMVQLGLAPK